MYVQENNVFFITARVSTEHPYNKLLKKSQISFALLLPADKPLRIPLPQSQNRLFLEPRFPHSLLLHHCQ